MVDHRLWLALTAVTGGRASNLGGSGGANSFVRLGRGGGDSGVDSDDSPDSGPPGVVARRLASRSEELLASGGNRNREYRESALIGQIVELNQQLQRERQVP
jgi:hypothetical protein